jgi:hypothetical protein
MLLYNSHNINTGSTLLLLLIARHIIWHYVQCGACIACTINQTCAAQHQYMLSSFGAMLCTVLHVSVVPVLQCVYVPTVSDRVCVRLLLAVLFITVWAMSDGKICQKYRKFIWGLRRWEVGGWWTIGHVLHHTVFEWTSDLWLYLDLFYNLITFFLEAFNFTCHMCFEILLFK